MRPYADRSAGCIRAEMYADFMKNMSPAALSNDLSNTRALGLTQQRFPIGGEA
jgi:hypothetical protein